jgi:hypothetical protein
MPRLQIDSAQPSLGPVYSAQGAQTLLSHNGHSAELTCEIWVDRDGAIYWKSGPVELTSDNKWLIHIAVELGVVMRAVDFRSLVPESGTISSNYAYVTGHTTSSTIGQPSTIIVNGSLARAKLSYSALSTESSNSAVIYHTIGMTGRLPVTVESPTGMLTQNGPSQVENYDFLHGHILIQAPAQSLPFDQWLADCDQLVSRVLDMVSLAEGRLIRWSVRQIEAGDRVLELEFNGPHASGLPLWPAFDYRFLKPVLDLAVNVYTEEFRETTSLAIALEWFVHHPQYTELTLTSIVTALEHLVSVENHGKKDPKLISKELFKKFLVQTENIFDDAANTSQAEDQEAIVIVKRKLPGLNSSTLRDKIERYLEIHRIPMDQIEMDEVHAAVAARNDVVHRGRYEPDNTEAKLYQHIAVLREVVLRVFLTLLQYQGNYWSFLKGPKWQTFPPAPPKEAQVGSVSQ